MFRFAGALVCLLMLLATQPGSAAVVDGLTLGPLQPMVPEGEPRGLVFLFSGEDGRDAAFDRAAARLATDLGVFVAPVDLPGFLARQSAQDRACLYLVSDIEEASRRIQAQGGRGRYLTPIVAGTGAGAAVAYAALAQAPDATLDGAASDGFAVRVATGKPLCEGAPASRAEAGGFRYGPSPLPGWWRIAADPPDLEAARSFAVAAGLEGSAVVAPPAGADLAARLSLLLRPALEARQTIAGLPLVELPAADPGRLMAVIYSGDGGWRDIDKEIAQRLQKEGIPVVGIDALRYFWSQKMPEQVASDLSLILDHYREAWQRPEVVLVGYSFGADVLPFAFNRLPADQRQRVRRLELLGLSPSADFEIHVTGWLGVDEHAGSLPTAPELQRLPRHLVQCFYGKEEKATACTLPELAGTELIETAGGHHFDGNYGRLANAIIEGARRAGP